MLREDVVADTLVPDGVWESLAAYRQP
ncbi:Protein of unknown function [Mycobacterium canettii CIPT 140070017]|nr:Protein of unknown function [Mycobacterium canettii CIPT 140070017]